MTEGHCSAVAASYRHRHEAELAAGYLEDAGVRTAVHAEDVGGTHPGLLLDANPVQLLVRGEELRRARRLLVEAGLTEEGGDG